MEKKVMIRLCAKIPKVKYHIQGREKGQPCTNDKAALNVILHDCTRTRGCRRYMGIACPRLSAKCPI